MSGFIRRKRLVPAALCEALRLQGLDALRSRRLDPSYHLWRLWGSAVNTPRRRHILTLPMCDNVRDAVQHVARWHVADDPAGGPRFSPLARLVELCVVISLPGAPQQRTHTDVAPFLKGTLWTTWVALQPVTEDMGPTVIYPYSHTRHGERLAREVEVQRHYDASGELEYVSGDQGAKSEREQLASVRREAAASGPDPPPETMLMDTGDGVAMDARVFHHGGQNRSEVPRVLLNITFQEAASGDGPFERMEGFTYHADEAVYARKYTLRDFAGP